MTMMNTGSEHNKATKILEHFILQSVSEFALKQFDKVSFIFVATQIAGEYDVGFVVLEL